MLVAIVVLESIVPRNAKEADDLVVDSIAEIRN